MKILKFSKKKINEQEFVCAKLQGKLKPSEFKILKNQLNDVVAAFIKSKEESK